MRLNLLQVLTAVRNSFHTFLLPDAAATLEVVLDVLVKNPAQLRAEYRPVLPALNTHATFFRLTPGFEVIDVQPALLGLLELTDAEQLTGQAWEQWVDPYEVRRRWDVWGQAAQAASKVSFSHLYQFRTPSGRQLTLNELVMPIRDPQTLQFAGWFVYVRVLARVIKIDEVRRVAGPQGKLSA